MAKNQAVDAQVGAAWAHQREGRPNDAIAGFEKVLETVPNAVDAYYGMGMALRSAGREADAVESFQKALEISQSMLQALRSQGSASNDLGSTEDDRYMMLIRMIKQRLAELGTKV